MKQLSQMMRQNLRDFPMIIFIRYNHIRSFHSDICSLWLFHYSRPVIGFNSHQGSMKVQPLLIFLMNRNPLNLHIILLEFLFTLARSVRTRYDPSIFRLLSIQGNDFSCLFLFLLDFPFFPEIFPENLLTNPMLCPKLYEYV